MKDIFIGGVVGALSGILLIILFPSGIVFGVFTINSVFIFIISIVLIASGILVSRLLGRVWPFFNQIGKFAASGILSTLIDFTVLNITSAITGIASGSTVGLINVPGFLIASINGYLWNKLWVFEARDDFAFFSDYPKFFAVTFMGLVINSAIVITTTTYINIPASFSAKAWLNVSKAAATAVSLVWNFLGYRLIVFKSKK